jgi:Nif-specific regulatory protein
MNLATAAAQNRHHSLHYNKSRNRYVTEEKITSLRNLHKAQFDVLYSISKVLNAAFYQESLVEHALDLVIEYLKADRGLFCKYDADRDTFSLIAARNIQQNKIENLEEFSSGVLRQVILKREACLYHDAKGDPDISQFKSILIHDIKSIIGVPVFYNDQIWGVILVDSQMNRQEFTEDNLIFLEFFANLISLILDRVMRLENLQNENILLRKQLESSESLPDIIGESRVMRQQAVLIRKVAQTDASVLILGESGTGKELVARALHSLSPRKDGPFIAQFCGSIPDTLLESELFGYKKGAFTGAYNDKKGLFEVASDGTFFLDEIADISLALQAKLLRVLENQEIIRLGDTGIHKVNVRIIAATNKDLTELTKQGKFRDDLFYRLNVFPVTIPPLRERRDDIPLLIAHFLNKKHGGTIRIDSKSISKLQDYYWPGNVRQLENVLQRAVILSDGKNITTDNILLEEEKNISGFRGQLKEYEIFLLKKRLEEFDGNRTLAAKSLGVSVRWVQLKLKEING